MQFPATIIFNTQVAPGYWRIRLTAPAAFAHAAPGQFVMVRIDNAIEPLLRRPFAVFDAGWLEQAQAAAPNAEPSAASSTKPCTEQGAKQGAEQDTKQLAYFEMLYHVVGTGTAKLASLISGQSVNILGPLGTGFVTGTADEDKLLVGGGIGLAPLHLLAKSLLAQKATVHLFAGGRSREDVLCFDEFAQLGATCHAATNDGSFGEAGFVTAPLTRYLDQLQRKATIYACGPMPMLRAVAQLAEARNVPCQVSLEGYMACGVGACLGCVAEGHNHSEQTPDFRCVCTEGPVFDARELKWEQRA